MRAPRNTTQFIMNQIYEDMRQQEKLERQQEALRAQQAQAGGAASPEGAFGKDAPPSGGQEDGALQDTLYSFAQNPSLVFSPDPDEEKQTATSQLMEEEEGEREEGEEWCDEEECDGKELESQEEDEESEAKDEEEGEEADYMEEGEEEDEENEAEETAEEEEGLVEEEQMEEENHLPLEMPLSFLVGAEEERENFMNCAYLSPKQRIPKVTQEALFMVQDINCWDIRKGIEKCDGTDWRLKWISHLSKTNEKVSSINKPIIFGCYKTFKNWCVCVYDYGWGEEELSDII